MKKKYTTIFLALLTVATFKAFAQCPASITASAVVTDASCPSNGSATINTSPAANSSFSYTIIAGPAGSTLNVPQSSNVFNALAAGNYTVNVSCVATQTTVAFTIADNYTPINDLNITATGSCGSFAPGGTVSVSVSGGHAPFLYSVIKSSDPNYADAGSNYTGSSSQSVSSYGIYQVRVKDACNQFFTKAITVTSPLLGMEAHGAYAINGGCGTNTASFEIYLYDPVSNTYGNIPNYESYGGVKINVWEQDPGGSCSPSGPLLYQTILSSGTLINGFPVTASKKYYIQTITACGDTSGYCGDASGYFTPSYLAVSTASGCSGPGTPFSLTISHQNLKFMVFPVTITIKNSGGTTVFTYTMNNESDVYSTPALPFDDYTVTAVDACGNTVVQMVSNPSNAGPPAFAFNYFSPEGCIGSETTTQNGTTSAYLSLTGYLPEAANANISIISGPSNVGIDGHKIDGTTWGWTNILPGTYVIRVSTPCGVADYTVNANPAVADLLVRTISAEAISSCSGGGTINAIVTFNRSGQIVYDLMNATDSTLVTSGLSGSFSNLTAGNYYITMKVIDCNGSFIPLNSNTVTLASGTGPQIIKKMGVACEDANGVPLTSGLAYISIAAARPITVEYKLAGAGSWTTYSTDAPAETNIPGLTSGGIYDVRVTSCGITTATQITIEPLGLITLTAAKQPCTGDFFEISLPQLSGASYEWKNAAGNVVSNAFNYTISAYKDTYNGQYTATMSWGSCLNRATSVTLNSQLCGTFIVLPVNLLSFEGRFHDCAASLNWEITAASPVKNFIVERSNNGSSYISIGKSLPQTSNTTYYFTDNSPLQGTAYYRLKMTGTDGHYQYSNFISLNARCNNANMQWFVFPAIVPAGTALTVKLTATGTNASTVKIVMHNITGVQAAAFEVVAHQGQNSYTLPVSNLAAGTYIVSLFDNKKQRIGGVQKFVYTK